MDISKCFHVRTILPSEVSKAMDMLMDYFFPFEPLCVATGVPVNDQLRAYREPFFKSNLESKLCQVMIHNDSKQWAACMFLKIYTKQEWEVNRNSSIPSGEEKYTQIHNVFNVLKQVEDLYPNVFQEGDEKVLYLKIIAVDPKFSGIGLAKELIGKEAEKIARLNGCSSIISIFSNIKTQNMTAKMGYEKKANLKFCDIKIDGKNIIDPNKIKDTTCAEFGLKRLVN